MEQKYYTTEEAISFLQNYKDVSMPAGSLARYVDRRELTPSFYYIGKLKQVFDFGDRGIVLGSYVDFEGYLTPTDGKTSNLLAKLKGDESIHILNVKITFPIKLEILEDYELYDSKYKFHYSEEQNNNSENPDYYIVGIDSNYTTFQKDHTVLNNYIDEPSADLLVLNHSACVYSESELIEISKNLPIPKQRTEEEKSIDKLEQMNKSLTIKINELERQLEHSRNYISHIDPNHEHYAPELLDTINLWEYLYVDNHRTANDSHTNDANKWIAKNLSADRINPNLIKRYIAITAPKNVKDKRKGKQIDN